MATVRLPLTSSRVAARALPQKQRAHTRSAALALEASFSMAALDDKLRYTEHSGTPGKTSLSTRRLITGCLRSSAHPTALCLAGKPLNDLKDHGHHPSQLPREFPSTAPRRLLNASPLLHAEAQRLAPEGASSSSSLPGLVRVVRTVGASGLAFGASTKCQVLEF